MTRILGIDPGLQHTGWGVIQHSGNQLSYIASGTIHTQSKAPLAKRLQQLHEGLEAVVSQHQLNVAAVEETFVNKNAASSLKLGHARGAIMLSLSLAGLEVHEYSANLVKKSVVGKGHADKNQVAMMVNILLPAATPDTADAADALAVAITHAHHGK